MLIGVRECQDLPDGPAIDLPVLISVRADQPDGPASCLPVLMGVRECQDLPEGPGCSATLIQLQLIDLQYTLDMKVAVQFRVKVNYGRRNIISRAD